FQALRIVEPVDSNDELVTREAGKRAFDRAVFFGGTRLLGEGLGVDADGKCVYLRSASVDLAPVATCDPPSIGIHEAIAKIIGVGLGLKPNDVVSPEAAGNPLIAGRGARDIGPGPRNMMEKTDPVRAAHFAQETRHGNEMIIVHPDRIIGPQKLLELAGKFLIDPEICGGIAFGQIGEVEAIMAYRPKRPVGEAAIILIHVATREVADRIGERSNRLALGNVIAFVRSFARPPEVARR